MRLSEAEREILLTLRARPNGIPFRDEAEKQDILNLARAGLVCDPHTMGISLFTRITESGRRALAEEQTP